MKELLLELLPNWRFCKIEHGVKGPRYSNWQHTPLTLEQVPANGNIGVLTGPYSGGILAVDFDGPFAWDFWRDNIKIPFTDLNTVMWSSGRHARCQMAFSVPAEMWEFIKTFKINDPEFVEDDNVLDEFGKKKKADGIEFRWIGVQSVLPPSMHPDTKKNYEWIIPPSEAYVQEIPLDLLEWIINYVPVQKVVAQPKQFVSDPDIDKVAELVNVMTELKKHNPSLAYDDWFKVTFSCMTHIGVPQGVVVMQTFYPESKKGEYNRLAYYYSQGHNPPGIGSLIERVRRSDPSFLRPVPTQRALIREDFNTTRNIF